MSTAALFALLAAFSLPAWVADVPQSTWLLIVMGTATAGAALWLALGTGAFAVRVMRLRSVANGIERFVIVPLRQIAPQTATKLDDTGLIYAQELVRALRMAADFADRAESVPTPSEVAAKVSESVAAVASHRPSNV